MENDPQQNHNPLERRLDLSVAIDALENTTDERLRHMGRSVKMPGFRPGKVPFAIVKQQYGEKTRHEALNEVLGKVFGEAVEGQKLNVAGPPRIEPRQSDSETHLEFSAVFEVYPEFTLGDLSAFRVERPVLDVTDAEVDQTIEILRKQRVRYVTTERPAAGEDRVVVDFLGRKDGVPFQGGEAHAHPFVLGRGTMLPDFEAAVAGMRAGETKTFDMTFPADYFAKELAGQTVQFEITVQQVGEPVLPEVDSEFARALGIEDGDVARMRAEIGENLRREVKKRIDARVKEQVMAALAQANPIPVPNVLVEQEIRRLVSGTLQDMARRGLNPEETPVRPEWFAEQARRRVALGLILAETVATEKLNATPEQLRVLVEEAAQTYEKPAEVVQWYYQEPQRLAGVEALAVENNVIEWALTRLDVTDKAVSLDELMGRQTV
jgi:trigger factor